MLQEQLQKFVTDAAALASKLSRAEWAGLMRYLASLSEPLTVSAQPGAKVALWIDVQHPATCGCGQPIPVGGRAEWDLCGLRYVACQICQPDKAKPPKVLPPDSLPANEPTAPEPPAPLAPVIAGDVAADAIAALMALGSPKHEAQRLLDRVRQASPSMNKCDQLVAEMLKLRR